MRALIPAFVLLVGFGIANDARADAKVDWTPFLETPGQQHPIKNDSTPAIAAAAATEPATATPAPTPTKTKAKKVSRAKAVKQPAAKTKRPAQAKRHK